MEVGARAPEVVPSSSLEHHDPSRQSDGFVQPRKQRSSLLRGPGFVRGLLLGLLCATILTGAALGGGLGATLSSCKARERTMGSSITGGSSPSAISAPTSTTSAGTATSPTSSVIVDNYHPLLPSQINTLYNDCDTSDALTNIWGATFTSMCGRDIVSGSQSTEGGVIIDIMGLTAYSFMDCINACSGFNWGARNAGLATRCRAVVFGTDIRNETRLILGNCWLKNGTLVSKLQGLVKEVSMSAMWVRGGPM